MLIDFQKKLTIGLTSKFAMRLMSYFLPHLQHVATLPCEKQYQK